MCPQVRALHCDYAKRGYAKTAIGFMKLEKPVSFDPEDPEKDARLFFTLASCNPEQHLNNMMRLSEMLMNEELVTELLEAKGPDDLLKLQEKYLDGKNE